MTQKPDDPVERQKLIEKLRAPWFTNGCEQYQREAADRIEADAATITELRQRVARMDEALTPSGDTKAAYMGEFAFTIMQAQEDEDGEAIECPVKVYVPWTTIKEIMAAIRNRSNDHAD